MSISNEVDGNCIEITTARLSSRSRRDTLAFADLRPEAARKAYRLLKALRCSKCFNNICKCVSLLLFLCLKYLFFFFCFVKLLRKSKVYKGLSLLTSSFLFSNSLFSSSFNYNYSSVICFKVLVVLLKFKVIVV